MPKEPKPRKGVSMMVSKNPFTPNFGQVPLVLAGRDGLISELSYALDNVPGDPSQTSILIGARGTGKTALLRTMVNRANAGSWVAVSVSCLPGMLEDIIEQVGRTAQKRLPAKSDKRLTGVTVGSVLGLEWEYRDGQRPNWRSRMSDVLDELDKQGLGLLIAVDEIDPELDEMIQLAAIYQQFVGEGRRVALLMAGLPHRVSGLLEDKSVSFLRRSAQYNLEALDDEDVRAAFLQTVDLSGKAIDDSALDEAIKKIAGFPYMLQLVGYRSWQVTGDDAVIDDDDVDSGATMAERDIRTRVLKATLDELSDGDLAFLHAMLDGDGPMTSSDIAKVMGKSSGYVSTYKRRLLDQGVIKTLPRGRMDFALPSLRSYLPDYLSA